MSMNDRTAVLGINPRRQTVTFLFYIKNTKKHYCKVYAVNGQIMVRPVTFKVSDNIRAYLKFTDFNETERDQDICAELENKGVVGCKTLDIILDQEIDPQEILDILLTFVESTIQRTNSGTN